MNPTKKRKNFLLDRETTEKLQELLAPTGRNLTELINQYFKAVIRDTTLLDRVDSIANLRRGAFIGLLDSSVGSQSWSDTKRDFHQKSKRF